MLTEEQRDAIIATLCVAFLVAVACYFSYAGMASQQPFPSFPIGDQKPETSEPNQNTTNGAQDRAAIPAVEKVGGAKPSANTGTEETSERKEKADNDWWLTTWTKVIAIATIVLAITAGGQAWFFWRQLRIMSMGLADTKETARAAQKSAGVADLSARAAIQQNQLTRDIFISQGRPWLRCNLTSAQIAGDRVNERISVTVEGLMTNFGKTPALNISYGIKIYSPKHDEPAVTVVSAFYDEHLKATKFSMANTLPGEFTPIKLTSTINLSDIMNKDRFFLWVALHCDFRLFIAQNVVREVGAIYALQHIGRTYWELNDLDRLQDAVLVEWAGARKIT